MVLDRDKGVSLSVAENRMSYVMWSGGSINRSPASWERSEIGAWIETEGEFLKIMVETSDNHLCWF
jgi:hypothetical protein